MKPSFKAKKQYLYSPTNKYKIEAIHRPRNYQFESSFIPKATEFIASEKPDFAKANFKNVMPTLDAVASSKDIVLIKTNGPIAAPTPADSPMTENEFFVRHSTLQRGLNAAYMHRHPVIRAAFSKRGAKAISMKEADVVFEFGDAVTDTIEEQEPEELTEK